MTFTVTGKGYGSLFKKHNGFATECLTMADQYEFQFPTTDDDERAIFLAAIQFIDMLYFEYNHYGVGVI